MGCYGSIMTIPTPIHEYYSLINEIKSILLIHIQV